MIKSFAHSNIFMFLWSQRSFRWVLYLNLLINIFSAVENGLIDSNSIKQSIKSSQICQNSVLSNPKDHSQYQSSIGFQALGIQSPDSQPMIFVSRYSLDQPHLEHHLFNAISRTLPGSYFNDNSSRGPPRQS